MGRIVILSWNVNTSRVWTYLFSGLVKVMSLVLGLLFKNQENKQSEFTFFEWHCRDLELKRDSRSNHNKECFAEKNNIST